VVDFFDCPDTDVVSQIVFLRVAADAKVACNPRDANVLKRKEELLADRVASR
jgi:hypothetical protein